MANPFDGDYGSEPSQAIKEGLLCPVCLEDFSTVNQLQEHFLSAHSDDNKADGSSSNFGSQIKGFIGKAKKKILNESENEGNGAASAVYDEAANSSVALKVASTPRPSQYFSLWRESQEFGQSRSHFEHLKQVRDRRVERYVVETNKLLIRLDKLLTDAPHDLEKRKQHEKNVVHWVADADVKLCPNCAKSFNLGRRRHHCRLCGGIMCHNCSQFLEFQYARKLISPTNLEEEHDTSLPPPPKEGGILSRASGSRRGSTSSLMSVMNASTGEPHIRVCSDCRILLDRRNKQIEDQRSKPTICHFYDRMKQAIDDCDRLVPVYFNMCYSFSLGESTYNLRDAQELRVKLMKQAELLDQVSRKIAALGTDEYPPPEQIQLQLQAKLRLTATLFLRENMVGLPSLPGAEDLEKAQEERRLEIQRRIQMEKQQALEEQFRRSHSSSPTASRRPQTDNNGLCIPSTTSTSSFELVSPDTGWGPECDQFPAKAAKSTDNDPMLLQINRVRSYVKQARADHRYDEVNMLEANLKELEIEYFIQKQEASAEPVNSDEHRG